MIARSAAGAADLDERLDTGSADPADAVDASAHAADGRALADSSDPRNSDSAAAAAVSAADDDRELEPHYDVQRAEAAIRELLAAVGEDPARSGLAQTPARVARAFAEQFAGMFVEPDAVLDTVFDENHAELVLVRDIDFYSTCEHHLLPFFGKAHVGYIPGPDGRVTGLSKLARLVEGFARRPQVQERLTTQIAEALMRRLNPAGAIVVLEAEHLCMAVRGVRKPGAITSTSAVRGVFERSASTRAEAMSLIVRR